MSPAKALKYLLDAVEINDVERVNELLDAHPNDDLVNAVSPRYEEAALHAAARVGSVAVASALLSRGANVDVRTIDHSKLTPLHVAAEHGHADIMSLLLSKGAAIDARTYWLCSALHLAAQHGQRSVVEVLLEQGARLESRDDDFETPLMCACHAGAASVVTLLLERGADVYAKSSRNWTPLHRAAQSDSCATVELLLSHGADIHATTDTGTTALHLCADVGVARTLLAHGANVEAQNDSANRPLYEAVRRKSPTCVRVLLAAGADLGAKGGDNQTAEQLAATRTKYTIARTLRNFSFLVVALLPRLVCAARALLSARIDTTATPTLPLPHALLSLVVEQLALAEIAECAPRFDDEELKINEGESRTRASKMRREKLTAPPDLHTQLSSTDGRAHTQLARLVATVVAFAARRPVVPMSHAQFDAPFRRDLVLLAAAQPDDDEALSPLSPPPSPPPSLATTTPTSLPSLSSTSPSVT